MTLDLKSLKNSLDKLSQDKKKSKGLVVYITNYGMKDHEYLFNGLKENISNYIAFVELARKEGLKQVLELLSGLEDQARPKAIIVDINIIEDLMPLAEIKNLIRDKIELFVYSEEKAWSDSIVSLAEEFFRTRDLKKILLTGDSDISKRSLPDLAKLAKEVYFLEDKKDTYQNFVKLYPNSKLRVIKREQLKEHDFDCLISSQLKEEIFTQEDIKSFQKPLIAIDAGINNFSAEFIKALFELGSEIIRIDNRAALSSYLISIMETKDLVKNVMGKICYQGITLVAGGYMGLKGDIIVDNISKPNIVIGVADGAGKVMYPPYPKDIQEKIALLEESIL